MLADVLSFSSDGTVEVCDWEVCLAVSFALWRLCSDDCDALAGDSGPHFHSTL